MMNPAMMKHSTMNVYLLSLGFTVHYATFPPRREVCKVVFSEIATGFPDFLPFDSA
jgi:hypothetical protein